jgi:hypothetical protein
VNPLQWMARKAAGVESFVDRLGHVRPLGNRPRPAGVRVRVKGPAVIVPRDAWVEFEYGSECPVQVKNQDGRGACNGHAAASSLEAARWRAGLRYEPLSAWYVYAILCGGWDTGSTISGAMELISKGVAPESAVEYGVINPRKLTDAARSTAPRFRAEIASACTTFDEVMSAVQLRKFGNFAVRVGGNFDSLDDDGVCGYSGGYGNHAVTFGFGAKRCTQGRYKGEWAFKALNSWDTEFGQQGYFWVVAKHIDNQAGFDAYVVESVEEDPEDVAPVVRGGKGRRGPFWS